MVSFPLPALCSISLKLPIYARLSLCLCSVQERNDHYTDIQAPTSPPLFRSVKILVAFLQFFLNFFLGKFFFWIFCSILQDFLSWWIFSCCGRFFFVLVGYLSLWLWLFLWIVHFFELSILIEKDSFFCKSGIQRDVQF